MWMTSATPIDFLTSLGNNKRTENICSSLFATGQTWVKVENGWTTWVWYFVLWSKQQDSVITNWVEVAKDS